MNGNNNNNQKFFQINWSSYVFTRLFSFAHYQSLSLSIANTLFILSPKSLCLSACLSFHIILCVDSSCIFIRCVASFPFVFAREHHSSLSFSLSLICIYAFFLRCTAIRLLFVISLRFRCKHPETRINDFVSPLYWSCHYNTYKYVSVFRYRRYCAIACVCVSVEKACTTCTCICPFISLAHSPRVESSTLAAK